VKINEIESESDWVEIANFGTVSVDVSGWSIVFEDTALAGHTFTFGGNVTIAPGDFLIVRESTSSLPGACTQLFDPSNIPYHDREASLNLRDAASNSIDFVIFALNNETIDLTLPTGGWTGPIVTGVSGFNNLIRIAASDTNTASDWNVTNTSTSCALNPGQVAYNCTGCGDGICNVTQGENATSCCVDCSTACLTCISTTISLNASGIAVLSPASVGAATKVNNILSVSKQLFNCSDIGVQTVIVTATNGNASSSCNASVTVTPLAAPFSPTGSAPGAIKIVAITDTTCNSAGSDAVYLYNTGIAPVDIGGWRVRASGIDNFNHLISTGTVVEALSQFVMSDTGACNGQDWGNEDFQSLDDDGQVWIEDASGNQVDYVSFEGTGAPCSTTNAFAGQWSGGCVVGPNSGNAVIFRSSPTDTNTAADWSTGTCPFTKGCYTGSVPAPAVCPLNRTLNCTNIYVQEPIDPQQLEACANFTVSYSKTNNSLVAPGTTALTANITRQNGTVLGTCSWSITSAPPPVLTCVNAQASPSQTIIPGINPSFGTATSNCPSLTVSINGSTSPQSTVLPVGSTTYLINATDPSGSWATCNFTITVAAQPNTGGFCRSCNDPVGHPCEPHEVLHFC